MLETLAKLMAFLLLTAEASAFASRVRTRIIVNCVLKSRRRCKFLVRQIQSGKASHNCSANFFGHPDQNFVNNSISYQPHPPTE